MATFAITANCNQNTVFGTIAPFGTTNVASAGSQVYTVTPSTGYAIDSLWVDNVNQGALTTYTFTNVLAVHTIVALFVPTGGLYCNQQDLINMIGTKQLTDISNDVANSLVPDPNVVMDKITEAYNYTNSELRGTFAVPLSPTPGVIHDINIKIAMYKLMLRKFAVMKMPPQWESQYKEACQAVENLKEQTDGLDSTLYPVTSPAAQMSQHHHVHGIDLRGF